MIIGIDFDNTLVCYRNSFHAAAKKHNIICSDDYKEKLDIKKYLQKQDKTNYLWERLQGLVYGKEILNADFYEGALEFIKESITKGHILYIVSHKTKYAHHDTDKTNLQNKALEFLYENSFFEKTGFKKENVFFCDTSEKKIKKIKILRCNIFIDDLSEILLHDEMPKSCQKILFGLSSNKELVSYETWKEIKDTVYG
tara:strand:- start:7853 stop:8446 length:594 start_codon:yes stop_codon:yes gene_type:complete